MESHHQIIVYISLGLVIASLLHLLKNWVVSNYYTSDEDYLEQYFRDIDNKQI